MKISVPILYFKTEAERRNAVDKTYKYFEECGMPYIAVLLSLDSKKNVYADYELINISKDKANPYIQFVQNIIDKKVNHHLSIIFNV